MAQDFTEVYDELRALAGRYFRGRANDQTLQPTALVNEAYLKIMGSSASAKDRAHFFALAATAMRQILVDHARRRGALKRGGAGRRVTLTERNLDGEDAERPIDLLMLDDLIRRLAEASELQARIVELRCFGGQTNAEIAEVLGIGVRSVERHWRFAKAWLRQRLQGAEGDDRSTE